MEKNFDNLLLCRTEFWKQRGGITSFSDLQEDFYKNVYKKYGAVQGKSTSHYRNTCIDQRKRFRRYEDDKYDFIPDGETVGEFEQITDYNKKTGRQKTFTQNTYFAEKFGRNEFDGISGSTYSYGKSIAYIMKYMEKQNVKAVYSRGLYEYFHSDIQGKDVICKMENIDETDNRLVLAPKFTCWDEGVKIGECRRKPLRRCLNRGRKNRTPTVKG